MKTIGIIGAMEPEISVFKSHMEIISAKQIAGVSFTMGKMSGKNTVVACSRAGKVNAAISAQVLIDLYAVDYIICTGVAGAVSADVEVCDVVIASDLVQHDFDGTAYGDPIGVNSSLTESFFKADEALIAIAKEACAAVLPEARKVHVGRFATGDQFIAGAEAKQRIWSHFKALCVDMESAAVAQVCFLNKIPFAAVRAISDRADAEAPAVFNQCLKPACDAAGAVVETMLGLI